MIEHRVYEKRNCVEYNTHKYSLFIEKLFWKEINYCVVVCKHAIFSTYENLESRLYGEIGGGDC
jgi:hypothetical protein